MKNQIFTVILFLIIVVKVHSIEKSWYSLQNPEYVTSVNGLSENDEIYEVINDDKGNIIITGYFKGKISFGSHTIVSNGHSDLFIAKKDSNDTWLWAINAGGELSDYGFDLACDKSGNLYVTGYFYDEAKFGSHTVTTNGESDLYVASADKNGNWRWAVNGGGFSYDKGQSIAIDSSSNVYVTGSFQHIAYFGNDTLNSQGRRDVCILKLDSNGNWLKTLSFGSSQTDEGLAVEVFNSNRIFIGGYFADEMIINNDTLTSAGLEDLFVLNCDTSLTVNWTLSAGSIKNDRLNAISVKDSVAFYTGYFSDDIDFGSENLSSIGNKDVFVASSNPSGEWDLALKAGGTSDDEGNAIIINSDNIFVTGYFRGNSQFGSDNLSSSGIRDVFLAELSTSGSWDNTIKAGGTSSDKAKGLALINDDIFVVGDFYGTTSFGSFSKSSQGGSDFYIAKINQSSFTWTELNSFAGIKDVAESYSIIEDDLGNRYITGKFFGQLKFGSFILSSSGKSDGFIAKMGPDGEWLWVKNLRGTDFSEIKSVTVDEELNIYVCGFYYGSTRFGSIQKNSTGLSDLFVAKLDKEGNWKWVKTAGNFMFDEALDITYYNENNIFVTGNFSNSIVLGSDNLSSSGYSDIFVASINASGNWNWAKSAGGNSFDSGNAVTADSSGNCLITGSYENIGYFGSIRLDSYGYEDFFIAKLDSSGVWSWAIGSGGTEFNDTGNDITSDESDNLYVTGHFKKYATFDDEYLISDGAEDIFLIKLDSSGAWKWLKKFGGEEYDSGSGLFYKNSDLFLTGIFSETIELGFDEFTSYESIDVFVSKMDTSGNIQWSKHINGTRDDYSTGIIIDGRDNLHVSGYYLDSITVDSISLSNNTFVDDNIFIASYGIKTPPAEWNHKKYTGVFAEIYIPESIEPKINGNDFTEGDAIGVYTEVNGEDVFGGFGYWDNNDLIIKVWNDDESTDLNDGFILDSNFKFSLWDVESGLTFNTDVFYESGPVVFTDSGYSVIKYLPKPETDTLDIHLREGWNLISSYLIPFITDIDSLMEDVEENMAIIKDSIYFYIPEFDFKTFDEWNQRKAYKVYMTGTDTLSLIGFVFPNNSFSINLNAGINIIPYLRENEMPVEDVFESLTNDNNLLIVKDEFGNIYNPELNINNINNLIPGRAYVIFVRNSVEFVFPTD